MKTMLDVAIDFALKNCDEGSAFLPFDVFFEEVENNLKEKWENEARAKGLDYSKIRLNKVGELYQLLTVDSRFVRNEEGLWSVRKGFSKNE